MPNLVEISGFIYFINELLIPDNIRRQTDTSCLGLDIRVQGESEGGRNSRMSSDGGRPALGPDVGNRFLDIGAPQSPVTSARRGPQVIIIILINIIIIIIIIRTLWLDPSLSPSNHSWSQSQVR